MSLSKRCKEFIVSGVNFNGMKIRLEVLDQINITAAAVSGSTVEVWDSKGQSYVELSISESASLLVKVSAHVKEAREAMRIAEDQGKTFIEGLRDTRSSA